MEAEALEGVLAIILIFGGGTLFALSMSPVGRAIADRIRGTPKRGAISEKDLEELKEAQMAVLDEVEALRLEVADVNERVDFAERMLAKQGEVGALPQGGETKA
jgi:hypothetical protein